MRTPDTSIEEKDIKNIKGNENEMSLEGRVLENIRESYMKGIIGRFPLIFGYVTALVAASGACRPLEVLSFQACASPEIQARRIKEPDLDRACTCVEYSASPDPLVQQQAWKYCNDKPDAGNPPPPDLAAPPDFVKPHDFVCSDIAFAALECGKNCMHAAEGPRGYIVDQKCVDEYSKKLDEEFLMSINPSPSAWFKGDLMLVALNKYCGEGSIASGSNKKPFCIPPENLDPCPAQQQADPKAPAYKEVESCWRDK